MLDLSFVRGQVAHIYGRRGNKSVTVSRLDGYFHVPRLPGDSKKETSAGKEPTLLEWTRKLALQIQPHAVKSKKLLPSAILAVAITTTITATAADRSQLEKLVQDSSSDLSGLTKSEIDAAAQS